MNLALSALLILLILLPAFSFRIGISIPIRHRRKTLTDNDNLQSQLTGPYFSKALSKLNFTETIFLFSLVPIALHLLSILIIKLTGQRVKFDLLLNIFSGKPDSLKNTSNTVFQSDLLCFLSYSLCLTIAGFLLGIFASRRLLSGQWILKTLMGNNIWYKLFTGLTLPPHKREKIALILVEILTTTKETTVVYSGWLKNYEVVSNNTEELSYITISSPIRRDLRAAQIMEKNTSGTESSTFYKNDYGPLLVIPGHNFTILGKEIINVNVTYMGLITDPADPSQKIPVVLG